MFVGAHITDFHSTMVDIGSEKQQLQEFKIEIKKKTENLPLSLH